MLRLPEFDFLRPGSVEEVVALMSELGDRCKVVAGGTDLLPNMKHGLFTPEVVIGLSELDELRGIERQEDGRVRIGAMTTLTACEQDPLLRRLAPGLAQAAAAVAGPSQRNMGTLGGNVCLDTRCVWYNQTHFWRKALGYCLKKDGTVCHVVSGGNRCVAAASNDTGTMLVALDAELIIQSKDGERRVAIRDFYQPNGTYNLRLDACELLTAIVLPRLPPRHHSGYVKLRPRRSIDFPKLSVAATYSLDEDGAMESAELVLSAIAAVPRRIRGTDELARGHAPSAPDFLQAVGDLAYQRIKPLTNLDGDTAWRREMIPVFVRRAFEAARSNGAAETEEARR